MPLEDELAIWDDEEPTRTVAGEMRADNYERLKLTEERRKLQIAKRKKFVEQRPCLELLRQIATLKLETARENRLRAEAERERARESRRAERERRRASQAEKETQELKLQTAQEMSKLVGRVQQAEAEAANENEKRQWAELGEKFDLQTQEWLTCPECGTRMVPQEHSSGRICPECCYQREPF